MENKYYTPNIEDFYVGYECEIKNSSDPISFEWEWVKFKDNFDFDMGKIGNDNDYDFAYLRNDLKDGNIRTPYLTREQIEAEGWKKIHYREYIKDLEDITIHFFNGNKEEEHDEKYLSTFSIHNKYYNLFEGDCPSINEFRKICKLLNIK